MSNSQGQRREIIRLPEFPRSSTPEPAPKRQRTSRGTSKNIVNIQDPESLGRQEKWKLPIIDSSERLSDPLEDRSEEKTCDSSILDSRLLRIRATHKDIRRLRQIGILSRRLSRMLESQVLLHESLTPLTDQASRS